MSHADEFLLRRTIAEWFAEAGRLDEAIAEATTLLGETKRSDFRAVLGLRALLALWHGHVGRTTMAHDEITRVIEEQRQRLGDNHEDTRLSVNFRAIILCMAGRPDESIVEIDQLLDFEVCIFGRSYPETLLSRCNLAHAYAQAGHIVRAINEMTDVLANRPDTWLANGRFVLQMRHALACWHLDLGQGDHAHADLAGVLVDQSQTLGADHPDTLRTRRHLIAYASTDSLDLVRYADAVTLANHAARVLGPQDPETLRARHTVALIRIEAGWHEEAITDLEHLVVAYTEVAGANAPDTLKALSLLALCRSHQGDTDRALADLDEVVSVGSALSGINAPDTLGMRLVKVRCIREFGDQGYALLEAAEIVDQATLRLGPLHHLSIAARDLLVLWMDEDSQAA